jgi:hypothetical protein
MKDINEKWNDESDRNNFDAIATDALPWYIYSREAYRSAEQIAYIAISAYKKDIDTFLGESNKGVGQGSHFKYLTVEEEINFIDSRQIRIAYFLLARAVELILKAVLIEIEPNRFFNKTPAKLKIGEAGHDIIKMMKPADISLSKVDEDNLKLLSHYPFIGTYPIPLTPEYIIEERKLKKTVNKNLNHTSYEQVSRLYDIVLTRFNEIRIPKGKHKRINNLKVKMPIV